MILNFTIAFLVFMVIDLVWIGFIAAPFYRKHLGFLMAKKINWIAAVMFYVILIVGMVVFVIEPALAHGDIMIALRLGALYGLITYATYDLTNLATLEKWPIKMVIVDMAWGISLSVLVSTISFLVLNAFV